MFKKSHGLGILLMFLVLVGILSISIVGSRPISEAAKKTGSSPQQLLLTGKSPAIKEEQETVQPEKSVQSAAVSFKLQAFLDDALTKPLDALDQSALCKAGQPFYIKVTALDAEGNIEPNTFFNTSGKTNVQGMVIAADATTQQQYAPEDFPNVSTSTMIDIAPGVAKTKAVFYNTGKIRLAFRNNIGGAVVTGDIGTFIPDHFAIVSNEGIPVLILRGNVAQYELLTDEQRTWGYIDEPVALQFTVQALAKNGRITRNYQNEVEPSVSGWGLSAVGADGRDYTSRLSLSGSSTFVHGTSEFKGFLSITEDPQAEGIELINDLRIAVNPHDPAGVSLSTPAEAKVVGHSGLLSGPYRLYSRVVDVEGYFTGYFTEREVDLRIQLEIWDGHNFVVNTLDSETSVELVEEASPGKPPLLTIVGNPVTFTRGCGYVSVSLNSDADPSDGSDKDYITHLTTKNPNLRTFGTLAWSIKTE